MPKGETMFNPHRLCRLWAVAMILSAVPAFSADLPPELSFLETLESNEAALVDAARRFQLQQFALMDWDQQLIDDYAQAGQRDLAVSQQESMQERGTLIRAMWEWLLERYPNNARAHNYYGEYLFDYAGNEGGGLEHWMTATQLDDDLGPAHNNLGIYYFHTGDYTRGLQHLERALKLEPDNADFLYNMAQMYLIHFTQIEKITKTPRDKLYKQAMAMSQKASELLPADFDIVQDYAVNFFAAENFGVEADWEAAAETWKKVQAIARTENERFYALLNEARAWMNGKLPKNAVAPLEAALALQKDNVVAQQLLAKARESA
jgi:tetratricopeptide (TPR) repeat protein